MEDILIDSRDHPRLLKVTIKWSKTDPFQVGIDLYLSATGATICPVKGFLPYLSLRGQCKGPLFILEDRRCLTHQGLCILLDGVLTKLHIGSQKYNTHSFCIRAATTAREANIPDALIQLMERWKSIAYLTYMKTLPGDLAKLSKCLITNYQQPSWLNNSSPYHTIYHITIHNLHTFIPYHICTHAYCICVFNQGTWKKSF